MAEMIYQNLVADGNAAAPASVHLCDFPQPDPRFNFPEIEAEMDTARKVVMLGRSCRNDANIKNRQPIAKIYIQAPNDISQTYIDIITDELNVKEAELTGNAGEFISYNFKPQLRTLGAKYGKLVKPIFEAVNAMDGNDIMAKINNGEIIRLTVDGTDIELAKDDILVETVKREGFVSSSDGGITVVIDTNLTPELIEEGFVREIISKVQTMRKDSGFEVLDNINIEYVGGDKIAGIFLRNGVEIAKQTLAVNITRLDATDGATNWNINGENVDIKVEKV